MAAKPLPDQAILLKLLCYDPETGKLYWRERTAADCSANRFPDRAANAFNAQFAGKEAFTAKEGGGYHHSLIRGTSYKAHRIIWKMVYGEDPNEIDHANGDRADNRLCNLRNVTRTQNNRNARRRRDNVSGATGVCWHEATGKWAASVSLDGDKVHLGLYSSRESAINARAKAAERYGFDPNHGRDA